MIQLLGCELPPREAKYLSFKEANGEIIDEGIAIYFPNPHSFTGEDVLELQGHGGPVVVDLLLQRVLNLGARLAKPGEFSERAFLNGKMDLAQAEAIADLINAASKQAARLALRSLQGDFSKEINQLNEQIIHLRMYIEAAIDFSDEEINFLSDGKILAQLKTILNHLSLIQQKAKQGSLLREGISAVIAGKPNVGKSSLLNALSGKETAIVTDIPGTTRDVLRDLILIDGMPMHIIDTAGLRESDDLVEQEGIKRAYKEIEQADLVLYVLDAAENKSFDLTTLPAVFSSRPVIFIFNKIDLLHDQQPAIVSTQEQQTTIFLSVQYGLGLDLLKQEIKNKVGYEKESDGIFLARLRHLDALTKANHFLELSLKQLQTHHAMELVAENLRLAHLHLCEITGEFSSDDLLGQIFSRFCIGK